MPQAARRVKNSVDIRLSISFEKKGKEGKRGANNAQKSVILVSSEEP